VLQCIIAYIQANRNLIQKLNPKHIVSIEKFQKLISKVQVEENLIFIHSNYGILYNFIATLETENLSLTDSIKIIENSQNKIYEVFSGTNTKCTMNM
jgi:hypothetical protein